MKQLFRRLFAHYLRKRRLELVPVETRLKERLAMGRLLTRQVQQQTEVRHIHDVEFSIFSQWGDDGIIQYLIRKLDIEQDTFIEFGVENYTEATTRFLLQNNNWRGLIFDGSTEHMEHVQQQEYYVAHDLTAQPLFVTRENINEAIRAAGFSGEIGLLHIDIDGNDYWIWESIEVVSPVIAIMEYNNYWGTEKAISIPYQADFYRHQAHHSGLYFGASLPAFCHLAEAKGYAFIGCTSNGNNAYFIRKDKLSPVAHLVCEMEEGYVAARAREHRDATGALTFKNSFSMLHQMNGLPVIDVRTGAEERLDFADRRSSGF